MAPRLQCDICNEWSRELIEVKSELGAGYVYHVHEHEVAEMKARVKAARADIKARKAEALRTYGQRYAH